MDAEKKEGPKEVGATQHYTYVFLFECAQVAIDCARRSEQDRPEHCLHSIVSTAFGLEAYLNHVGPKVFRFWRSLKWLRPREKLDVVCTQLGISPDHGSVPFQAFGQAFAVRDMAAHAETITLPFERPAGPTASIPEAEPSTLEAECTLPKAERTLAGAMEIVRQIHKRSGEPTDPFWFASHTTWTRPVT